MDYQEEFRVKKIRLIKKIIKAGPNGERRIARAALSAIRVDGYENASRVIAEIRDLMDFDPEAAERVVDLVDASLA